MTRDEAKSKASIRIQLFDAKGANKVIDEIYNDHEAELEAKDDEIRRLNNLYADTIKDLGDALIEIERMKGKTQVLEVLVDNTKDIIELQTRMCRTKARSIVAMLFWEWRRNKRILKKLKETNVDNERIIIHTGFNNATKHSFYKAYEMLKEQQ